MATTKRPDRIVGVNFNMDAPLAKKLWAEAFGEAVPFDAVYSGRRRLTRDQIQRLFDVGIQEHEKRLSATGAQLNENQRLAVLAHYADRSSGSSTEIDRALAAGDSGGILYHLLYDNIVKPMVTKAADAAVEKVKSGIQSIPVIGGLFGSGGPSKPSTGAPAAPAVRRVDSDGNLPPTQVSSGGDAVRASRGGFSYVAPVTGTWAAKGGSDFHDARGTDGRLHSGNDLQAANGSKAVAAIGGTVLYAGYNKGYQYNAVLKGDDGNVYRYATHGPLDVKVGDRVEQGAPVGTIDRGHLHFEVVPAGSQLAKAMIAHPGQFIVTQSYPGQPDPTIDPAKLFGMDKGAAIIAGQPLHPAADLAATSPGIPSQGSLSTGGAAAYARAVQFVGPAAAETTLPSYDSYSLGHVMIGNSELRESIIGGAHELGVSPIDLATAINFETAGTFDMGIKGPVSDNPKYGQMIGGIQWNEPNRIAYGVGDKNGITVGIRDQMKGIVQYLKDTGVKPGMGLANIYAAINAHGADRVYAVDKFRGGTTVLQKVALMGPNRAMAEKLLGDSIPYEAKLAMVVTGAGLSAQQAWGAVNPVADTSNISHGPSYYGGVGSGAQVFSATPFSTFTYGPGATSMWSGGMGSGYSDSGFGDNSTHTTSGYSGGGSAVYSGDAAAGVDTHTASGGDSSPSRSYSGSGNYSNVGEGGGGYSSHTASGGDSSPSRSYSGSGNYSNVGEGGSPSSEASHGYGADSGGREDTTNF